MSNEMSYSEAKQNWARLIQKIYEVDPLICPKCQGTMKIISIVDDFMIRSFKHKRLKRFFTTGSTAGINPKHAARLEERLQAMDIPGWRLHALKGDHAGLWAVNVSGNWRVVFEFKDGHAHVVNYEDYH